MRCISGAGVRAAAWRVWDGQERRSPLSSIERSLRAGGWRTAVIATAGAAGVAVAGLAPGAAGAAAAPKPHDVTVKIDGIGLGGQPVTIPSNQTALWDVARADDNPGPIYGDPDGRYRVLPGTYLVGGYVPVSNGHYQNTVVIRTVTIRASETITLDSQGARAFSVALTGASAQPQGQFADVCVRGGSGASSWATGFMPGYVTPGGSQYVVSVPDGFGGFISLRSIVTDVKGNSTGRDHRPRLCPGLSSAPTNSWRFRWQVRRRRG